MRAQPAPWAPPDRDEPLGTTLKLADRSGGCAPEPTWGHLATWLESRSKLSTFGKTANMH